MAAKNDKAEDKAPETAPEAGNDNAVLKQAALGVSKRIRVPKALAGGYMSAHFDDNGVSANPVAPSVIEALKAQFPGIPIEDVEDDASQA